MERESGIYKIEQISLGKVYIGSSKNMYRRCHRHMSELRHGKHNNSFLQRAFKKYGENDFRIVCLEKCPKEMLIEREQFYMDQYSACDEKKGFNLSIKAYSCEGRIASQETKNKLKKHSNSEEQKEIRKIRMTNLWKDEEYRNHQTMERKERYKNSEFLNKRKEVFNSIDYKFKRSEIAKNLWKDESFKEKLIKERKDRWKNDDYKKRLSESAKKKWENPEFRKKQSEKFSLGQKKRSQDPEYRKQCSERAKAQWANRKKICSTS